MKHVRAQFRRRWMPSRAWWFVCLVLLAVGAILAGLAWQSAQRIEAAKLELLRIEVSTQQLQSAIPQSTDPTPPPYDGSAREMLAQSTVAWPALLAALEAVSEPGVRLVNVDYVATESRARVDISFANHAAALEYVEALSAGLSAGGSVWRWKPLSLSQPRSADKGVARLEATWASR